MSEPWISVSEAARRAQRPRRTMFWWLMRLNRLEGGRLLQRANEGGRKWLVSVRVLDELLSKKRAERKGGDIHSELERLGGLEAETNERVNRLEDRIEAHRMKIREHENRLDAHDREIERTKRAIAGLRKSSEGLHEVARIMVEAPEE